MRYIRYAFLATLGVVLVAVALANRSAVTLKLLPNALSDLLGLQHTISLPLFVVIFASVIVGIVVGFAWEWLREHKHRSGKSKAERELAKTQRDLRRVKGKQSEGKDEVLALLDEAS